MNRSTHGGARVEPGPNQESAWDYPRPPRVEPTSARLRVVLDGVVIADTTAGFRARDESPSELLPPARGHPRRRARAGRRVEPVRVEGPRPHYAVRVGSLVVPRAAWGYADPSQAFRALIDTVAFYPALMDECTVDDELVRPQAGGFYGGWITDSVVGPFKGEPGSRFW